MSEAKDSVQIYLQEIGRTQLLTASQEIKLARTIADWLQLEAQTAQFKERLEPAPTDLQLAQEIGISLDTLRQKQRAGRLAKNQMIQSNLRLVVSIAKKYLGRGLSLQDLVQEGAIGLIRATEKFDPQKGCKFSTYAVWWIRQSITRAVSNQSRTIRLPYHLTEKINQIKQNRQILTELLGRTPTELEIAKKMQISLNKLRFIERAARPLMSLDKSLGEEDDLNLSDILASSELSPEAQLLQNQLGEDLNSVLNNLSEHESLVLRLRYGINTGYGKTLDQIGQVLNFSRERVRLIEAKALRKLRHPKNSKVLKEYIV